MRSGIKHWLFLLLVAAAVAVIAYSIHAYRYRFVRSDADLVSLLPERHAMVFFVNVRALRHAGVLHLLTGPKTTVDPEYQDFVRQTNFDYTQNLDAVAGSAGERYTFLAVRGRFDWGALRRFAATHGGSCANGICQIPGNRAGRWIGFRAIQPDVLALSLGDSLAVAALPLAKQQPESMPNEPVWVRLSAKVLSSPGDLPVALRIFAISMQSMERVTLALAPAAPNSGAVFELKLDAWGASAATAETARNQLQIQTKMLQLELAHEHQQANPSDLTGLLTAGTFAVNNRHLTGKWPVHKELLNALEY